MTYDQEMTYIKALCLLSNPVFAVSFICMYELYLNKILFKPKGSYTGVILPENHKQADVRTSKTEESYTHKKKNYRHAMVSNRLLR